MIGHGMSIEEKTIGESAESSWDFSDEIGRADSFVGFRRNDFFEFFGEGDRRTWRFVELVWAIVDLDVAV